MRPPAIVPHSVHRATVWEVRDFERCLVPGVCGNKARKFAGLNDEAALAPFVSHGGSQSNAMLALAALAAHRRVGFTYHTKPMPRWLRANPIGNLAAALSLGMELREHSTVNGYEEATRALAEETSGARFVPQGGACPAAEPGVASLARDIGAWHSAQGGSQPCHVVLPAGTGTTALFLARHAPPGVRVFAVPCVGDEAYLRQQIRQLERASGGRGSSSGVEVLSPPPESAVAFGTPSARLLRTWREAAASGVLLDLLYGAVAWDTMVDSWLHPGARPHPAKLLYVNCGGHEGLPSQLMRYRRAGLLDGEEPEDVLETVKRHAASSR